MYLDLGSSNSTKWDKSKETVQRQLIIKLWKVKDKETILKAVTDSNFLCTSKLP